MSFCENLAQKDLILYLQFIHHQLPAFPNYWEKLNPETYLNMYFISDTYLFQFSFHLLIYLTQDKFMNSYVHTWEFMHT